MAGNDTASLRPQPGSTGSHDCRELNALSNVDIAMNRPEPRPQFVGRQSARGDSLATDEWCAHADECPAHDRQLAECETVAKNSRISRSGFMLDESEPES
jgi:hypothetical protein